MGERESHTNTDIEVLRAIAVAFTIVCHMLWGVVARFGAWGQAVYSDFAFWTGVDLFFAISGFVITASLLRDAAAPTRSGVRDWTGFRLFAGPFWIRRVFRLLPSAWLWIGVTLLLAAFCNGHQSFGPLTCNLREAAAALVNAANFYFYDWFARGHETYGSLGVYWSLSLEEQFYLLFPFLFFFLPRRALVIGLVAAFIAQFFVARPDGFDPHHASLLWFVRTDALIIGVLIAFWQQHAGYRAVEPRFLRSRPLALTLLIGGVALLAGSPAIAVNPCSTGIVALVSGALVLIASYDRDYLLRPSRLKRVAVWVGTRSYSIYLTHTLVRALVLEVKRTYGIAEGGAAAIGWSIASLALVLLISEANHRWIERPLRRVGRRIAARYGERTAPAPVTETAPALEG